MLQMSFVTLLFSLLKNTSGNIVDQNNTHIISQKIIHVENLTETRIEWWRQWDCNN